MNKLGELTNQQLFEIKQKFLREIPHPKLIVKQLKFLNVETPDLSEGSYAEPEQLAENLNTYISNLMQLKLSISNAASGLDLGSNLVQLHALQSQLIAKLSSYCPESYELFEEDGIKQSDPFDVYSYIKELGTQGLQENEIKDYLCKQFELADPAQFTELAKGVVRARKIIAHGR